MPPRDEGQSHRLWTCSSGQFGSGQFSSGQFGSGQFGSGQFGSGQFGSGIGHQQRVEVILSGSSVIERVLVIAQPPAGGAVE